MTASKTTGKIKFEYTIANLVSEIINETILVADKLSIEKDLFDEIVMDERHKTTFDTYLKEIHSIIISKLVKLQFGITDDNVNNGTVISYTVNDKANYNGNIIAVVDENIYQVIKAFLLKEWYLKCNLGDLAKYYNEKYLNEIKVLVRNSLSLRKPTLT